MEKAYHSAAEIPPEASIYHPVEQRRICVFVGWCAWDEFDNSPTQGEYRLEGQVVESSVTSYDWFEGLLDAGAVVVS